MPILIVESNPSLGAVWARHLSRLRQEVIVAQDMEDAIQVMQTKPVKVIVLDLMLEKGSAFAVADYASYRHPEARVVFVTSSSFFSDGSLFRHVPNACAFLGTDTPPDDLAAMVDHYATAAD